MEGWSKESEGGEVEEEIDIDTQSRAKVKKKKKEQRACRVDTPIFKSEL